MATLVVQEDDAKFVKQADLVQQRTKEAANALDEEIEAFDKEVRRIRIHNARNRGGLAKELKEMEEKLARMKRELVAMKKQEQYEFGYLPTNPQLGSFGKFKIDGLFRGVSIVTVLSSESTVVRYDIGDVSGVSASESFIITGIQSPSTTFPNASFDRLEFFSRINGPFEVIEISNDGKFPIYSTGDNRPVYVLRPLNTGPIFDELKRRKKTRK